jgi:DNA invertase Pin-like site-specific DNA recombinase
MCGGQAQRLGRWWGFGMELARPIEADECLVGVSCARVSDIAQQPITRPKVRRCESSAATGNRPGFQQVMAALRAGDVLLVAHLTRPSRSQELAPLLDRLRFRGVRVVGVLDGFDSDATF